MLVFRPSIDGNHVQIVYLSQKSLSFFYVLLFRIVSNLNRLFIFLFNAKIFRFIHLTIFRVSRCTLVTTLPLVQNQRNFLFIFMSTFIENAMVRRQLQYDKEFVILLGNGIDSLSFILMQFGSHRPS